MYIYSLPENQEENADENACSSIDISESVVYISACDRSYIMNVINERADTFGGGPIP
jgi:hypothetical protein